jgi:hypothetical protein
MIDLKIEESPLTRHLSDTQYRQCISYQWGLERKQASIKKVVDNESRKQTGPVDGRRSQEVFVMTRILAPAATGRTGIYIVHRPKKVFQAREILFYGSSSLILFAASW